MYQQCNVSPEKKKDKNTDLKKKTSGSINSNVTELRGSRSDFFGTKARCLGDKDDSTANSNPYG